MKLDLTLEAIGEAPYDDFADFPNDTPHAIFARKNGAQVMLIGLTREECQALASMLFDTVTIGVQP